MYTSLLALFFFVQALHTPDADRSLAGKWQDVEHADKQILIHHEQGKYQGQTLGASPKTVFKDLVWDGKRQAYKGTLIHPDNGRAYPVEIIMVEADMFQFVMGAFVFKKTFRFKRI